MARAGMSALILGLRALTNAGTADYSVNSTTYWSDDQLQAELDKTQRYYRFVPLLEQPLIVNGVYQWFDYLIPPEVGQYVEENQTGSGWVVRDMAGGTVNPAAYSVNVNSRRITFTANTGGSAYALDVCAYDVYTAAAMIWRQKASFEATNPDWSSDNHNVRSAQKYEHCLAMAKYYETLAAPNPTRVAQATTFVRTDENDSPWSPADPGMDVHGHINTSSYPFTGG